MSRGKLPLPEKGEVPGVINEFPADLAPILEAIADRAARLCESQDARIFLVDGNVLRCVAGFGDVPIEIDPIRPVTRGLVIGRAVIDRTVVHVDDLAAAEEEFPEGQKYQRRFGFRTVLGVPLVREDKAIGVILMRRSEVRPYDPNHIELVKAFADQAAVAIENLRLSTELKARNAELSEALEQQTATAEILRVISGSPTDIQPVFDAIARSAARLCEASEVVIRRVEGDVMSLAAHLGSVGVIGSAIPISGRTVASRAVLERHTIHVHDVLEPNFGVEYPDGGPRMFQGAPFRTLLVVPMVRENMAIGMIAVRRTEVRPFSAEQIKLLETFAAQAAIAIENVRLFNETKEALEQQTVISEILRVISSSPTNTQPVFDAIVKSGVHLFGGLDISLLLVQGNQIRRVASTFPNDPDRDLPLPLEDAGFISARAILRREVVHLPDVFEADWVAEETKQRARRRGTRAILAAPLVQDGRMIGAIGVDRKDPGPFPDSQIKLLQTFADQAVIAIENVRLFNETREALERQTATSEVLRAISESQTNTQPVFDAIVRSAVRLCGGSFGGLVRIDGDTMHQWAHYNFSPDAMKVISLRYPAPISEHSLVGLAVRTRDVVHSPDTLNDPRSKITPFTKAAGFRAQVTVPLVREGNVVGALNVLRDTPGPFSEAQIQMLRTFADQAVIAIENVRLFNETKEALEQQTATADILRVIASSPTDIQPVLDAVAENAAHLCGADDVMVRQIDRDGLRLVAHVGPIETVSVLPMSTGSAIGRAVTDRRTIHIHDSLDEQACRDFPDAAEVRRQFGIRTMLAAPLLREGVAIGAIGIRRLEVRPFSDSEIKLLETFAAQAAIAIENVRLFNETKEALEQQTATAEILKVISSSPTDVQPVLDAVAKRSGLLCRAEGSRVWLARGGHMQSMATYGTAYGTDSHADLLPLRTTTVVGRAFLERRCVHVEDIVPLIDTEYPDLRELQARIGFRTVLAVPMLREGESIGVIALIRNQRPFAPAEINLIETFAAQSVIAIENVRLFNELQARNAEITESLEQQTATAEILKVISGSPTDIQPVLDAVAESAARLCSADDVVIRRIDGDMTRIVAHVGSIPVQPDGGARSLMLRTLMGTVWRERQTIHIPDVTEPHVREKYPDSMFAGRGEWGVRTHLIVPLLREGLAIGAIIMRRLEVRPFTDKQIKLLETFAAQAVIAIENVRLFNETKDALDQQKASAEVLRVISSSVEDTKPVFEAILQSSERLFAGRHVGINLVEDDEVIHLKAYHGPARENFEDIFPLPLSAESGSGTAILEGRVAHYPDVQAGADVPHYVRRGCEIIGIKSIIFAPMLWEGRGIGAIFVGRDFAGAFSEKEIALLKTFADQAVIAIENVRLFKELQARNAEITESLEQQTATAEILKVISSSPTDTRPVFNAIAKSGVRLFDGLDVSLRLVKGDQLELAASTIPSGSGSVFSFPHDGQSAVSRSILWRDVVQYADIFEADWVGDAARQSSERRGIRAVLSAPMLRENIAIGAIVVSRAVPGLFTDKQVALLKTFADQAVIAIENARLFKELQARNVEITESLEQQRATAEILRVISSSPTDTGPVFDAIVNSGVNLFDGSTVSLRLVKGDHAEIVASSFPKDVAVGAFAPLRDDGYPSIRAMRQREVVHVPDMLDAEGWVSDDAKRRAAQIGFRAIMSAPMLRENVAIGAIQVFRPTPGPYTDKQVALLKTFADQAVIAIENVRLFNETKEALEQQTVISEILRVISSSPTDVQPVFDTIVKSGVHLFGGMNVSLRLVKGDHTELVASTVSLQETGGASPIPLGDDRMPTGRAILRREVIQVPDVLTEEWVSPRLRRRAEQRGFRAILVAPMLRENKVIGTLNVARATPGPFTEKQIALLKTFADQAVIAIENVRLFKELQARNTEITESLEQQTATAEILKVISSSPTDTQPVFNAIVKSGVRLFDGLDVSLRLVKGDQLELAASTIPSGSGSVLSFPHDGQSAVSRSILRREVVQYADILDEDWVGDAARRSSERRGIRAVLSAPMLRGNSAIGAISVTRAVPGLFTEKQVALLKTFADQAVIAIENVRLFKELQARNAEITESLEQQTATAEILKVISSSPTDIQPVFDAILENATRLCDGHFGLLGLYDGETYQPVAQRGANADFAKWLSDRGPFKPASSGGVLARMIAERRPIHIADHRESPAYRDRRPITVAFVEIGGARTYLAVPMLKEGRVVGGITIYRPEVRPFTQKQIDLVSTFANQAVIAIENVRLFRELQARNAEITEALQQQTATSEILQVISGSPTDVKPILDMVAHRAAQLCDAQGARVYVVEGDIFRYVAGFGAMHTSFINLPLTRSFVTGRAVLDRSVVHIEDLTAVLDEYPDARGPQQEFGTRSMLAVPLMRENEAFGAILLLRKEVRPFTENQIELLKTFAHQAAIGIENVRLFNEIQEKGRQLEIANKHKSEFLANMSHELRTPLNAVIGFSEALVEKMFGELNPKQEDYLRDIHSSGRHLLSLINDILDLSKIEAGRMELELSEFSLPMALKNAMTLVRERAQTHSIEMKLHVDPKLGDIRADERKFKQIVLNLLSNAVKFTPNGGRVEVDARRNGGSLKVSVKDTGVGIATKDQAALFEEFRQVGRGSTGKREGTGLGLALTRRFVELHGGKIGVESKPGKGSTFTFTLPLKTLQ